MKTIKQEQIAPVKFNWTVNDEDGQEIKNSLFDSLSSPMDDFIDDQCLHFEENFVNFKEFDANLLDNFDQLNDKFLKKIEDSDDESFFEVESTSKSTIVNEKICKKCGHDILKL